MPGNRVGSEVLGGLEARVTYRIATVPCGVDQFHVDPLMGEIHDGMGDLDSTRSRQGKWFGEEINKFASDHDVPL